MVSVNKSTAAFMRLYRESGGGAQVYNISVVDPAELVKLAGLKNAHGLGISQIVPYRYMANQLTTDKTKCRLQIVKSPCLSRRII